LEPEYDVSQLIGGERSIEEVLIEGPHGLRVLPGGSGIAELSELNEGQLGYFAKQLMMLEEGTDITLVDCSAGITKQVLRFMASAHDIVVVITPEVTSMIDGYAVIKNVHRLRPDIHMRIVVNRVREKQESKGVFQKMREVATKRLGKVNMSLLGEVPHDRYVLRSITLRKPVVNVHPRCYATSCFTGMADVLGSAYNEWKDMQSKSSNPVPSYFCSLAGRYGERE
jgi:flagellar biosynthesis protein FlhG